MRRFGARSISQLVLGASALAIAAVPGAAAAQDAGATVGQPGDSDIPAQGDTGEVDVGEEIVVTGIRGSLRAAVDIKRNGQGVVDAISAEDIGKFPDTNLAESLQRITGVSISRANGEGSQVAVRGFSGGFNLVTLNGRQLASSSIDTSTGNALATSKPMPMNDSGRESRSAQAGSQRCSAIPTASGSSTVISTVLATVMGAIAPARPKASAASEAVTGTVTIASRATVIDRPTA